MEERVTANNAGNKRDGGCRGLKEGLAAQSYPIEVDDDNARSTEEA